MTRTVRSRSKKLASRLLGRKGISLKAILDLPILLLEVLALWITEATA